MREYDIGIPRGEELRHGVHVRVGHFGRAVDLAEEHGLRAHDLASSVALRGANPRRFVERFAGDATLAAREIDDRDRMSERRITSQCSTASGLGIVRMPADTHYIHGGLGPR